MTTQACGLAETCEAARDGTAPEEDVGKFGARFQGHAMSQNATEATRPPRLSPQQIVALEAIVGGSTIVDAARAAGVARETVHRWLRDDYEFRTAHNAALADLRTAAMSRMERATTAAAEVVLNAVLAGDVNVALKVLHGLGWLSGADPLPIGSSSAAALRAEDEAAAEAAARARRQQAMMATLEDEIHGFGLAR